MDAIKIDLGFRASVPLWSFNVSDLSWHSIHHLLPVRVGGVASLVPASKVELVNRTRLSEADVLLRRLELAARLLPGRISQRSPLKVERRRIACVGILKFGK